MAKQYGGGATDGYLRKMNDSIRQGSLGKAIEAVGNMAAAIDAPVALRDELQRISSDYGLLKRYALDGADDPRRGDVMRSLTESLRQLAARMERERLTADSPTLYFSTLRYESMQSDSSISGLVSALVKVTSKISLAMLGGHADAAAAREREEMAGRLFRLVWVTHPLRDSDMESLTAMMADESIEQTVMVPVISAMMLGGLDYFDRSRIMWLGEAYLSARTTEVAVASLCSMLLLMWRWRDKLDDNRLAALFDRLRDSRTWKSDVRMAQMIFLRARDTERITRKMNDEFIPGMMKIKPEIERKLSGLTREEAEEMLDPESNPEWEELLQSSGIADKMKELSEIQADGGDVMMSTFSHLKGFPFFNEISNWFLPFTSDCPAVTASNIDSSMAGLLESTGALCDSDKFSIVFSISQIPEQQRRMMFEQFRMQGVQEAELRSAALDDTRVSRESKASAYVRNLYRFFKLFRRKNEFSDPFASPVTLPAVAQLADCVGDTETRGLLAEFYFKRGYHVEALELYKAMIDDGANEWQIYQKTGYCLQSLGRIDEAVEVYGNSELINSGSVWTLRRLAQCLRASGRTAEALDYYRRLESMRPDDAGIALSVGHCLLETGDCREALKAYFKADFIDPDSGRAWRPIVWCSLIAGDYDRARDYSRRILDRSPQAEDYLNAGHLALIERRFRDAVELYRRSIAAGSRQEFAKAIEADLARLSDRLPERLIVDIVIEESYE